MRSAMMEARCIGRPSWRRWWCRATTDGPACTVSGASSPSTCPAGRPFVDVLRDVWDAGDAALPGRPAPAPRRQGGAAGRDGRRRRRRRRRRRSRLDDGAPGRAGRRPRRRHERLDRRAQGRRAHPRRRARRRPTATCARLGVTQDDHWLACLPLSHVGGLGVVTRAMVDRHVADRAAGVRAGARRGRRRDPRVARRRPRCGASTRRCSARSCSAARRRRPTLPPNVVTTYGMTETGSGVVYDGRPLDGVEVARRRRRADPRSAARCCCGPTATAPTRSTSTAGWRPATSAAGSPTAGCTSTGRAGDLIITGGENVWPEPVEAVAARPPGRRRRRPSAARPTTSGARS